MGELAAHLEFIFHLLDEADVLFLAAHHVFERVHSTGRRVANRIDNATGPFAQLLNDVVVKKLLGQECASTRGVAPSDPAGENRTGRNRAANKIKIMLWIAGSAAGGTSSRLASSG